MSVQRRIFASKGEKEMGLKKKTHNEELHNLYFSATISVKEDVMGRHVARVG
jgi:hypothetical protein